MKKPQTSDKAAPVDKPDGPAEHIKSIRFLVGQIRTEKPSAATTAALDKIALRLDALEA